jgi:alpha-N-arabinofuranosidase
MKQTFLICCLAVLALQISLPSSSMAKEAVPQPQIEATVHLDQEGAPIHPFVHGMFTELLGNMFENGIWAEMLSDRKFFYPVDNSETLNPRNSRRHQLRWRPVGPESAIQMDKDNAYVGKQSPLISLASGRAGIRQAGLWLENGRGYTGRVILKAEGRVKVTVSLVWGNGASDRQSFVIDNPSKDYKKYPFSFTAGADVQDAALEIVGEGSGSFEVGAVSLMPADNVEGYRADILAILKEIGSPIYRWPGGNFLSGYEWRDGIGDPDQRPPRYDYAWNTVESNDMGTDEYLTWCRLLGSEPYLVVNTGFGDAYSAAQWVEYVNGSVDTPMGLLRAKNGHPAPYGVIYWGVGNEGYGEWQLGHMSPAHYVLKHNYFGEAMLEKDPSIKLIASGASVPEQSSQYRNYRKPFQTELPVPFLGDFDWTGQLLKGSLEYIDYMSEHIYPNSGAYFDDETDSWIPCQFDYLESIRLAANRVKNSAESMDKYEEMIPGVKEKHVPYWIDEWAGGRGRGFQGTIGAAVTLHEMYRYSYYVMMAGITSVGSLYTYNDNTATISSTGLLFKLFIEHLGDLPLGLTGNSPQKAMRGTPFVDIPLEPSGSPTYPLDIVATKCSKSGNVMVSVVNPTEEQQTFALKFDGGQMNPKSKVTVYALAPAQATDANTLDNPGVISVQTRTEKPNTNITVPPHSVILYEFIIK